MELLSCPVSIPGVMPFKYFWSLLTQTPQPHPSSSSCRGVVLKSVWPREAQGNVLRADNNALPQTKASPVLKCSVLRKQRLFPMCSLITDPEEILVISKYPSVFVSEEGEKNAKGFHLQNLNWIMTKKNPYWKQSSTRVTEPATYLSFVWFQW